MQLKERAIAHLRFLTVDEYHQMANVGIFDPDERVELLEGKIWQMAAKGAGHSAAVTRCDRILRRVLGNIALVRLQDPIQLDDYSEPEPDIAVVVPDIHDYEACHPKPEAVYLLVEVADTTLKRDLDFKMHLYAKSGIVEYWVLDVINRQIYIFRNPSPEGYQSQLIVAEGDVISLMSFSDRKIMVTELLRSQ